MSKEKVQRAVLAFGGYHFIMEVDSAVALFKNLRGVEIMDSRWNSELKKSEYFVRMPPEGSIKLEYLSEEQYAVGKLLAKAEEAKQDPV